MNDYVFNYNQYKNTINKKQNFNFLIIFFVIILLLGLIIFIRPKKQKLLEFYFVELGCFQTYQQALNLSNEINSNGNSSFVYFNGDYHVIVSFYSNYDDAKKVVENLQPEYANASLFTLEFKDFVNQNNLSKNQNSSIENFLNVSNDCIKKLENLSLMFDKKEIDYNELSFYLKDIKTDFCEQHDELETQFKFDSKHNIMKEYAYSMFSTINQITSLSEQDVTKNFRYLITKFVIGHYQFLSCF